MKRAAPTKTLPPFNSQRPLRAVRLRDGALGVVDDTRMGVWREYAVVASPALTADIVADVALPPIPPHYGRWVEKSVGGVSHTVRRTQCIKANNHVTQPVVVFATRLPAPGTAALEAACDAAELTVVVSKETEYDSEYGHVGEVLVHHADELECVCALVARCGGVPLMEDATANAQRDLGIERLDRIDSAVTDSECVIDDTFGPRRGTTNWKFAWMPPHWTHVPITWDHMVANVAREAVETLPDPLRQHAAKQRLEAKAFQRLGTLWCVAELPPTPKELECMQSSDSTGAAVPYPLRRAHAHVPHLSDALAHGKTHFDEADVDAWEAEFCAALSPMRTLVCAADGGVWYRPRDTRSFLQKWVPLRRHVSAALGPAQSRQLITAFYVLSVERTCDAESKQVASLLLYRYMLERGYTARWMGKYEQAAHHIGNGDRFRRFSRLLQYDTERIPADVINRLCTKDGRLRNNGSKGTRSKYKVKGRYVPKRRLPRTDEDEERMAARA